MEVSSHVNGNDSVKIYIGCTLCASNDHSCYQCSLITDYRVINDMITTKARSTLPYELRVEDMADGTTNVIAQTRLERGVRFGPFKAKRTKLQPIVPFPIRVFNDQNPKTIEYLDTENEDACNWMCLVAPAVDFNEQNLVCYQLVNDIYFSVIREIDENTSLRVWYAPYYAEKINQPLLNVKSLESDGLDVKNMKNVMETMMNGVAKTEEDVVRQCKFCESTFTNVVEFCDHIEEHYRKLAKETYVCVLCDQGKVSEERLKRHYQLSHGVAKDSLDKICAMKPPNVETKETNGANNDIFDSILNRKSIQHQMLQNKVTQSILNNANKFSSKKPNQKIQITPIKSMQPKTNGLSNNFIVVNDTDNVCLTNPRKIFVRNESSTKIQPNLIPKPLTNEDILKIFKDKLNKLNGIHKNGVINGNNDVGNKQIQTKLINTNALIDILQNKLKEIDSQKESDVKFQPTINDEIKTPKPRKRKQTLASMSAKKSRRYKTNKRKKDEVIDLDTKETPLLEVEESELDFQMPDIGEINQMDGIEEINEIANQIDDISQITEIQEIIPEIQPETIKPKPKANQSINPFFERNLTFLSPKSAVSNKNVLLSAQTPDQIMENTSFLLENVSFNSAINLDAATDFPKLSDDLGFNNNFNNGFHELLDENESISYLDADKSKTDDVKTLDQSVIEIDETPDEPKDVDRQMNGNGQPDKLGQVLKDIEIDDLEYKDDARSNDVISTNKLLIECPICNKTFKDVKALRRHSKLHKEVFKCRKCSKTFTRLQGLKQHPCMLAADENFECLLCPKQFNAQTYLKRHMRVCHTNKSTNKNTTIKNEKNGQAVKDADVIVIEDDSNLQQPDVPMKNLDSLNNVNHNQNVQDESVNNASESSTLLSQSPTPKTPKKKPVETVKIPCTECMLTFKTKRSLANHVKILHTREVNFICEECGTSFAVMDQLKKHTQRVHKPNNYKCSYCTRTYVNSAQLVVHINRVHNDGAFQCGKCDLSFYDALRLKLHLGVVHGEGAVYKCEQCNKPFLSEINYKKHLSDKGGTCVKSPTRNVAQCTKCDKLFTKRRKLKLHMLSEHQSGVVYKCDVCPKQFITITNFKRHQLEAHHTNNIQAHVQCDKCPMTFAGSFRLQLHESEAHAQEIKPIFPMSFTCKFCSKYFATKQELSEHWVRTSCTFNCPYCEQMCKNRRTIRIHLNNRHKEKQPEWNNTTFITKLMQHNETEAPYVPSVNIHSNKKLRPTKKLLKITDQIMEAAEKNGTAELASIDKSDKIHIVEMKEPSLNDVTVGKKKRKTLNNVKNKNVQNNARHPDMPNLDESCDFTKDTSRKNPIDFNGMNINGMDNADSLINFSYNALTDVQMDELDRAVASIAGEMDQPTYQKPKDDTQTHKKISDKLTAVKKQKKSATIVTMNGSNSNGITSNNVQNLPNVMTQSSMTISNNIPNISNLPTLSLSTPLTIKCPNNLYTSPNQSLKTPSIPLAMELTENGDYAINSIQSMREKSSHVNHWLTNQTNQINQFVDFDTAVNLFDEDPPFKRIKFDDKESGKMPDDFKGSIGDFDINSLDSTLFTNELLNEFEVNPQKKINCVLGDQRNDSNSVDKWLSAILSSQTS